MLRSASPARNPQGKASFRRPSLVGINCAATFEEMNANPFGSTTPSRYPDRLRTQTMSAPFIW